ncbi:ABC transporter permease subunit [Streptomyces xantholiticus]|uniref:Xylose transport system permease protein XylH n=1 Tax=Streptomyces xantholiticus TaxID=68285 RepID=A0ABV1V056_9ACTN
MADADALSDRRGGGVGRHLLAPVRRLAKWGTPVKGHLRRGDLGRALGVLGLVVLWLVFQAFNSNYLSARNLSNISVDMVGTGMIAMGIIVVLLLGELDLSVGSIAGLATAVFAVVNVHAGLPEWLAVVIAVVSGTAIGAFQGSLSARFGVPAFIVTLAGLVGWTGLMLYILGTTGTFNFDDGGLVASLTGRYFGDKAAAYGLAAVGVLAFLAVSRRTAHRRQAAGLPSVPLGRVVLETGVLAALAFAAASVLNHFQGLPLALLIFLAIVAGLDHTLRRMPFGRKVFALGTGAEAARRAGIDVTAVRISAFAVSGTMAAVGGLFLASPTASTIQATSSPTLLLNALAAAVLGGGSLFGGHGRAWSVLLGVLVIQSIASGVALVGIQPAVQLLISAGVLLVAVIAESGVRRARTAHGLA